MASKSPSISSQESDSKKSRKSVNIEKKLEVSDHYARKEKTSMIVHVMELRENMLHTIRAVHPIPALDVAVFLHKPLAEVTPLTFPKARWPSTAPGTLHCLTPRNTCCYNEVHCPRHHSHRVALLHSITALQPHRPTLTVPD
ncbi:hypothetical protein E2C01_020791 [Portunus trituberculatus]|uniref:Uncharacterized protein n=1 Tax=Portunus trituberculatus TaxID=210409 RepID=A0A5B7E1J2_PORTR|nr:hypothetical protein [Portunus trituberculatus]